MTVRELIKALRLAAEGDSGRRVLYGSLKGRSKELELAYPSEVILRKEGKGKLVGVVVLE